MFKEISEDKQIIITTHESEVIKYADSENILLISRDNDGFSTICRPFEKENVKIFLQNELRAEYFFLTDSLILFLLPNSFMLSGIVVIVFFPFKKLILMLITLML
jgi:hypothetical protein